ncbi:barstar family protein [Streptomyces bambusae]|uniref:barstar family protein n=1 Tax=Streptomyces bambusae TaxID=1550616 RepID=UPI001CFEB19D|nr:barstar family protein [Streptomyces bambusae]MCB5164526.1 barstar family protein [Streptomyces bambusae]
MEFKAGITFIGAEDVGRAVDEALLADLCVLPLRTGGSEDRDAIFEALRRDLPMDPPSHSSRSWDAISDSLFGGLFNVQSAGVVIVWEDAGQHQSLRTGPASVVLSVLAEVADLLGSEEVTRANSKVVSVLVPADTEE